ncbi:halovibrin HvnA [Pseudomonas cichorii]|nr:halovibrin HvnA [Pseudomonas cichorii]MBX8580607.1 halovibrin HvnA [Pseudomonas cichorii]MBX8617894.1 halovibrin HvnA [Pseudomonas cichorii]
MKHYVVSLALVLLMGCAHEFPAPSVASSQPASGAQVAADLQAAYMDVRPDCGSGSLPAFLCSGVMFRGTSESQNYRSWNPRPGVTSVSFSYLRKDANFDHLAVNLDNGLIFYPSFKQPAGKDYIQVQVLCAYPVDGNTWIREPLGCGQSSLYPDISRRCQSQGIDTAEQWKAHFDKGPSGADRERLIYSYVCSFDLRDRMGEQGAASFYQTLRAMETVPRELLHHYNELVVQAWPQDIPLALPIQAFFYTVPSGLAGARHDQWDYHRFTGVVLPIIQMHLPCDVSGTAVFNFDPEDQYLPFP